MEIVRLKINRVIRHTVPSKGDGLDPQIGLGTATESLDSIARDAIEARLVNKLGNDSKCIELELDDHSPSAMYVQVLELPKLNNPDFVTQSQQIANRLFTSQTSKAIPGGVLIVVDACFGSPPRAMIALIKAEVTTGFANQNTLKFLDNLLLTDQSKLYKVGAFVEPLPGANTPCEVFVYDAALTLTDQSALAKYFYKSFLGCELPKSGAFLTKAFYDLTIGFINKLSLGAEEQTNVFNAIVTYLMTERSAVVSPSTFAQRYLPPETHDDYLRTMKDKGLPSTFPKDTTRLGSKLGYRKLTTKKGITIRGRAEIFKERIKVHQFMDAESQQQVIRIDIRDQIDSQQ